MNNAPQRKSTLSISGTRLVLAIDIGTSSCRTGLFDADASLLPASFVQESYLLRTDASGMAVLDPMELMQAVDRCTSRSLENEKEPVAAVGVSTFWHSMLGLDRTERPVTPILTWADGRCREEAAALRRRVDEVAYHRRTGCMLRASFWPARLRWWMRAHPEAAPHVARWISPAEWLQLRWCGKASASFSMASGTGLFQIDAPRWDAAALRLSGVRASHLSGVSDEPGTLLPSVAKRFPLLAKASIFPGIGDGAASNLGSGATQPGIAALNFGTSAALRVVVETDSEFRAPTGLFHYRIDAARTLAGGAISNAGSARAWCLANLRLPEDPVELERLAASRAPMSHGLCTLPFLLPERAPSWNEHLSGMFTGLRQHHDAADLYLAVCEASYQRLAMIHDRLREATGAGMRIIAGGGLQKSPALLQRLCDALGAPLYPNAESETSLRGAAVFVLERLGCHPPPRITQSPLRPRRAVAAAFAKQRTHMLKLESHLAAHNDLFSP